MTTSTQEIRLGQDELLGAIRERPEKVLAAIMEMCDTAEEMAQSFMVIPLATQQGIVEASQLQGRVLALQNLLGEIFEKLTEKDLDEDASDRTE